MLDVGRRYVALSGKKKRPHRHRDAAFEISSGLESQHWDLNPGPLDYESSALPLSYAGDLLRMPWRGLEPRRLAAPPPQDGVSTNFTTRAYNCGPEGQRNCIHDS